MKISLTIDDNQKDPNDYFDDGVRKIDFILVWTRSTKYEGKLKLTKVGYAFPMVISSDFHMRQYIYDDPREDAPHFRLCISDYAYSVTYLAWSRRNRKNQFISNPER